VKGVFRLRGSEEVFGEPFDVAVSVAPQDQHLVPEVAARKAFIEEATKRLGEVNLNDWELLRVELGEPDAGELGERVG
jgi:hypothetical protein